MMDDERRLVITVVFDDFEDGLNDRAEDEAAGDIAHALSQNSLFPESITQLWETPE